MVGGTQGGVGKGVSGHGDDEQDTKAAVEKVYRDTGMMSGTQGGDDGSGRTIEVSDFKGK
jgi:hypothetical protein